MNTFVRRCPTNHNTCTKHTTVGTTPSYLKRSHINVKQVPARIVMQEWPVFHLPPGGLVNTHTLVKLLEARRLNSGFGVTARPQPVGCVVFEAMDPLQTDPTSMSYICKVVEKLHMLWMGTWTCPHSVSPALIGQAFGSQA